MESFRPEYQAYRFYGAMIHSILSFQHLESLSNKENSKLWIQKWLMVLSFRDIILQVKSVAFILILISHFFSFYTMCLMFPSCRVLNYIINRCDAQIKHHLSFFWITHILKSVFGSLQPNFVIYIRDTALGGSFHSIIL